MSPTIDADRDWLRERYPRLVVSSGTSKILLRGLFDINLEYKGITIQDSYRVRFEVFLDGKKPILRVTDDRLKQVLANYRELKHLADLHMYENGSLCTITPQGWDLLFGKAPDVKRFFLEYVEPYFYSQSYFEKNGEWPWEHYAHNTCGLLQWHFENWQLVGAAESTASEILKLVRRDRNARSLVASALKESSFSLWNNCICGSGKAYLECHPILAKLSYEMRAQTMPPAAE